MFLLFHYSFPVCYLKCTRFRRFNKESVSNSVSKTEHFLTEDAFCTSAPWILHGSKDAQTLSQVFCLLWNTFFSDFMFCLEPGCVSGVSAIEKFWFIRGLLRFKVRFKLWNQESCPFQFLESKNILCNICLPWFGVVN